MLHFSLNFVSLTLHFLTLIVSVSLSSPLSLTICYVSVSVSNSICLCLILFRSQCVSKSLSLSLSQIHSHSHAHPIKHTHCLRLSVETWEKPSYKIPKWHSRAVGETLTRRDFYSADKFSRTTKARFTDEQHYGQMYRNEKREQGY